MLFRLTKIGFSKNETCNLLQEVTGKTEAECEALLKDDLILFKATNTKLSSTEVIDTFAALGTVVIVESGQDALDEYGEVAEYKKAKKLAWILFFVGAPILSIVAMQLIFTPYWLINIVFGVIVGYSIRNYAKGRSSKFGWLAVKITFFTTLISNYLYSLELTAFQFGERHSLEELDRSESITMWYDVLQQHPFAEMTLTNWVGPMATVATIIGCIIAYYLGFKKN